MIKFSEKNEHMRKMAETGGVPVKFIGYLD